MAYKIVFTEDALTDLEIILEFVRADDPDAAERFGAALLDHIEILANFPRLGVSLARRPAIRKILHSPIRVYYQVDEENGMIEILHLWHAADGNLEICTDTTWACLSPLRPAYEPATPHHEPQRPIRAFADADPRRDSNLHAPRLRRFPDHQGAARQIRAVVRSSDV